MGDISFSNRHLNFKLKRVFLILCFFVVIFLFCFILLCFWGWGLGLGGRKEDGRKGNGIILLCCFISCKHSRNTLHASPQVTKVKKTMHFRKSRITQIRPRVANRIIPSFKKRRMTILRQEYKTHYLLFITFFFLLMNTYITYLQITRAPSSELLWDSRCCNY